eukprot:CAMPEP_0116932092 /NCGR_PEP_ID=MMETSP0467-20121206/28220_1 /TAXON_ID=283647 /ORGANISM="Mesodinium pulex, Strain SPMC105" /LENGTH=300 /DNA_ID=CAMNT_0004612685 /DNA_START=187 /DNA_END=1089 /DNA_ORIENTATION=+
MAGFRGIWDIVVKFPAEVHKVNFSTQQVTKEMQGLEVSGMMVWGIYREQDGPMRAYRHLGKDIENQDPYSANDKLTTMSNAIVRHCIANSTIEVILKDRKFIRDALKKELNEVAKGWGVWVETIEITDVKILSSKLFGDLQSRFRETSRQKAQMDKLVIQNETETERLKADVEMNKKKVDSEFKQLLNKSLKDLEVKQQTFENLEKENAIAINNKIIDNKLRIDKMKTSHEKEIKSMEISALATKNEKELQIAKAKEELKVDQVRWENSKSKLENDLKIEDMKKQEEREDKKKEMELMKP